MKTFDLSLYKYLSSDDKDNFNLICDAVVNKKSNVLITNDDEKTLNIIHESLLNYVNKNSENNLAIYDSKKLENFVADTLLGSFDNALSKLNQNKEKQLKQKYYKRVLFVENGHLLDKNEINVLLEANKTNSYGYGVIVIFFNTRKKNNDLLDKINLFGKNVFEWEPDQINYSSANKFNSVKKQTEEDSFNKDEENKNEVIKDVKKTNGVFSRLISLSVALLAILLLLGFLAFLGGYDFKNKYITFTNNGEMYLKKIQELFGRVSIKNFIDSENPNPKINFYSVRIYDIQNNPHFFLQHFASDSENKIKNWYMKNNNKIENCKIIKLKRVNEEEYYFAIISGPYKTYDDASDYKKNNMIAKKSWIRPANRIIKQATF